MAVSKLLCIFVVKIWHIFIAPDVNRKKLMKERFSKRIGLQPVAAEITVRCDAPEEFRRYLFFVMQNFELGLKKIREIVCIAMLGGIIKKHPDLVPPPLHEAISKIWGFSSEQGRHLREGRSLQIDEAELFVHLSASICLYLSKK